MTDYYPQFCPLCLNEVDPLIDYVARHFEDGELAHADCAAELGDGEYR